MMKIRDYITSFYYLLLKILKKIKENKVIIFLQRAFLNYNSIQLMCTIFFVLFAYLFMYKIYGGYFCSNDDTGMMMTISGYCTTGKPTSYHQFVCTILGVLLKSLYVWNSNVSWYSLFYIFSMIVSVSFILFILLKCVKIQSYKERMLVFLCVVFFTAALSLTGIYIISWTVTSVFLGLTAIMMLLLLINERSKKYLWIKFAISLLFLVACGVVRDVALEALIPFFILMLAYILFLNKSVWKKSTCVFLALIACFFTISLNKYFAQDRIIKASMNESYERNEFEKYRPRFSDYPVLPYEGNEEFYASIGWDKEFFDLSRQWMYIDRRFNAENLKKISEASQNIKLTEQNQVTKNNIFTLFLKPDFGGKPFTVLTYFIIACFLTGLSLTSLCIIRKKWKYIYNSLLFLGANALAICECLYLCWKGRYISSAFLCAALPSSFISFSLFIRMLSTIDIAVAKNKLKNLSKEKYLRFLASCAVLSLLFFLGFGRFYFKAEPREQRNSSNKIITSIERYCIKHNDYLIIHDGVALSDTRLFLDMSLSGCRNNLLFLGGTGVFSQGYYDCVMNYGFSEFYSDNLLDDNVLFMTGNRDLKKSEFMEYMKKAYGENIDCELIDNLQNYVYIYKFRRC